MPLIESQILEVLLFSYLLGSFPSGVVFTKIVGSTDIRKMGSGNIGATNVLRTGNKFLALLTLISDLGKGLLAIKMANLIDPNMNITLVASLSCLAGHIFPIWIKFKGGKGVATAIGILFALSWQTALIVIAIWSIIAAISRYSSLAALTAFTTAPLLMTIFENKFQFLTFCLTIIIWITHKKNIKRLFKGQETKINLRKNKTN